MKIAIMQPYFFPYIGYWQLIDIVDVFVIYDDVNYINRGFINRNFILINGKPHRITLQLIKASQNKLINEIKIGDNKHKILKTIELSYKKAKYFNDAYPLIKDILLNDEKNLAKFIGYSIEKVNKYLDINTKLIYSSEIKKEPDLKAQKKIIYICKKLNADVYINPIGGLRLYNKEDFEKEGIKLYFLKPYIIHYKQFKNEFIPNLSIIDIMMFNNKSEIKKMLKSYELI